MEKKAISKKGAGTAVAEQQRIDQLTERVIRLKQTAGEAILELGRSLIEAKAILPHGEWLPWLTEKVDFSERTAQNFMRLAEEYSNPQTLADLGASKALALLAIPSQEEREAFIAETHIVNGEEMSVGDMSSRELKQAIKERDEARAEIQKAKGAQETLQGRVDDLMRDNADMEARGIELVNERDKALQSLTEAKKENMGLGERIKELEKKLTQPIDVAVEKVADPEAIKRAKAEARAELQAQLEEAKKKKSRADEKRKAAEDALAEANLKLEMAERAAKQAAINSDSDLATFNVLFEQAQEVANKLHGLLIKARGREDKTAAESMAKALVALSKEIGRCAE